MVRLFSFGSRKADRRDDRREAFDPGEPHFDQAGRGEAHVFEADLETAERYTGDHRLDRRQMPPEPPALPGQAGQGRFQSAYNGQPAANGQAGGQANGQAGGSSPPARSPPPLDGYQRADGAGFPPPDDGYRAPETDVHYMEGLGALCGPHAHDDALAVGAEGWLTISGVKKSYKRRNVVKGVSLAVRRGESVGLLGPNGAGKTTVFYMITGLVPADDGIITIDGHDVTKLPMYRRARLGIGYLPQEASIFRGLSVEKNIMAVLELVEPSRRKRKERLDQLLEEFRITDRRKLPSIALSGGERRRCEIARALASDPAFMLLDEPFAGVDPLAVGDIQYLVRHLTERGIGVLITDHNVRETLDLVERAYVIYEGQVLTEGNPQEIINNEDVRRVYLGDMFVNGR